ncbi:MAG: hypothetical protein R6V06_04350 [Kiritimatiellia bacterium]
MNCEKHIKTAALLIAGISTAVRVYASYNVSEEWSTYVGGLYNNDKILASAIDANGMVYFGGMGNDGSIANDDGIAVTENTEGADGNNGVVAAVDSFGNLQWFSIFGSEGALDDKIRGITEYGQNVYAAAMQERSYTGNYNGEGAFLYKLSKTDGSEIWNYSIDDLNSTNGFNAVTVDTNGNIYAVGYTSIAQIDPSPNVPGYQINGTGTTYGHTLQGGLDAVVVKVSPSNTLEWVHYLGGENDDTALACTIGPNGYLYVGGETCSTNWVDNNFGVSPSKTHQAGFVVKLNAEGDYFWSCFLGGTYDDAVTSLAVESVSGKIFAAGTTFSGNYMYLHNPLNEHMGGSDGFVTSITDNGSNLTVNWSSFYGSGSNEAIASIQQLDDSEMIIGGTTDNGTWLPDADNPYSDGKDAFITVLQEDSGTNLWSTYAGGNDTETLHTLSARKGIFVAGGMTRSEGWVTNGFHTTWDKQNFFPEDPAEEFGYLCKYQSNGYVPDLPEITSQPQSVTVEEQQDADFSIAAVGTQPISFQWKVNGLPIADATNTAFSLSTVQLPQDGDMISCTLSNVAGTVDSENALLTVTAIPNGWITINISPVDAVAAGAAWSIDSGSTWHDSGDVVNVITGQYAITCKDDLFGWAAPTNAVESTTVLNGQTNELSATYTEVFYTNYREITGTNVTVVIDPPEGSSFFVLTETLPAGLTPYDYTPDTSWDSVSRELTYFRNSSDPAQFTYSVTGTTGLYRVSGKVDFGEISNITAGPDEIVIGGGTPTVPDPDIIGFAPDGAVPGNFLLTFISVAGQEYLVQTNAVPGSAGWGPQAQVNGNADQTTTSVPAPHPALFYRVRTEN